MCGSDSASPFGVLSHILPAVARGSHAYRSADSLRHAPLDLLRRGGFDFLGCLHQCKRVSAKRRPFCIGGDDGNRTHVRRSIHPKRYHHSRYFAFSSVFPCRQGHTLVASSNFFYLLKALKKKFPALIDALFTGAGTCGRTCSLIKLRKRNRLYC